MRNRLADLDRISFGGGAKLIVNRLTFHVLHEGLHDITEVEMGNNHFMCKEQNGGKANFPYKK